MEQKEMAFTVCTVAFFGHRTLERFGETEAALSALIRQFLDEKAYTVFLVGRDGDFDRMVASTVRGIRRSRRNDSSALVWVLPYPTADFAKNQKAYAEYYDDVILCEESGRAHFKAAFGIRNRYMVDRADYVVCYVARQSGGAYRAMRYAEARGKTVVNLYDRMAGK